jgi:hypothetical protein
MAGTDTQMRMQYLATEIGCQLRLDSPTTYSLVKAYDNTLVTGPGATLASTENLHLGVDPTIAGAT